MADANITKHALASSLKNLMREKSFDKISVSDICDGCGMNRKSFYYHFKDKYDLVEWIFKTDIVDKMDFAGYDKGWDLLLDLCGKFYAEKDFYRAAFKIDGQNGFKDYVLQTLEPIAKYFMQGNAYKIEADEFGITFFGDAFLTAVMRWLREGMVLEPEAFVTRIRSVSVGLAEIVIEDEKDNP
nr:TetR/AcrR family transcriptional regulator C-terminal domain-containing protein [uncultured Butyrivibrio sp.]